MTRKKIKATIKRKSKQSILIFLAVMIAFLITAYIAALIILRGPSPTLSNLVTSTLMETRRGKAVAHLFFSSNEIEEILQKNTLYQTDEITDYTTEGFDIPESEKDNIQIIPISGPTYKGTLMIIRDPSRIELGVNVLMNTDSQKGFLVEEFVASENAIAGINAGGFDDPGGKGDGSIPYGIVIKDGELVTGKLDDYYSVIGFNDKNRLVVGNMTAEQALSYNLKNAVSFGPVLIVNYEAVPITGTGGGLNPRTVIGQREDGAVLLLAIDGRQTTSLGASYSDCIDIMMEYGAMNAANLDGGSSTVMVYEGEIINNVVSMNGDRRVPTAWIVK
ncbi:MULTISPECIES: phosphodiester glycosidase family protein [Anaerorhabdus]|uniref:Exopolysaccharide biosynthesis protein n=1 Tax=Anaerorhabdus furcosa TaxID=118967 RepID=A0A1T4LXN0_9FIRM|nr:phosphodiester glycosidase family protein [Anaerorhabdus furcosa]SJZ59391.1 Exopolysaccharide biosynthesis protein [Anaerorhabdus furcosa]